MNQPKLSSGAIFHDFLAKNWNDKYESGGFKGRIFFLNCCYNVSFAPLIFGWMQGVGQERFLA